MTLRMRIGVVVVARAPGSIVRNLEPRGLHIRRVGRIRLLELLIVNHGNVTETLGRNRVDVTLLRRGKVEVKLQPDARELQPRTRGIVQLAYRGRLRGWVTARVRIWTEGGRRLRRTFWIRL